MFGLTMTGVTSAVFGLTITGVATDVFGLTITGVTSAVFGLTITGVATDVFGLTITGVATAVFGLTMTGELAASPFCTDEGCAEGAAATALIADRARTEPRATHETFNHDEVIGIAPQMKDNLNLQRRLTQ